VRAHRLHHAALAVLALALGWLPFAGAADLAEPLILVARPEVEAPMYKSTVLVVTPLGGDRHVGFIVNRPTGLTLAKVVPEYAPAKKISDPVYQGGPELSSIIFALVQRVSSPGANAFEVIPGLYAVHDVDVLHRIIESEPQRARFVAGLVTWRAGELRAEIDLGAWYVLEPDAALVMRPPEGLWEHLVRRAQGWQHGFSRRPRPPAQQVPDSPRATMASARATATAQNRKSHPTRTSS